MKGQRHEWRERDESGEMIVCRGTWFAARWQYAWRFKKEEDWVYEDPISLESLRKLREKVWSKYQRNRVSFKQVEGLDELIEEAEKVEASEVDIPNSYVGSEDAVDEEIFEAGVSEEGIPDSEGDGEDEGEGEGNEESDDEESDDEEELVEDDGTSHWDGVSVADLQFSVRVVNALTHLEISTVGELLQWSRRELVKSRLFSRKSLEELEGKLVDLDLQLDPIGSVD